MHADPVKTFGAVLQRLRKARGLSQEALAAEAHLDRTFVSQLETGRKQPSLLTIYQLAHALELSVSQLFQQVEAEHLSE